MVSWRPAAVLPVMPSRGLRRLMLSVLVDTAGAGLFLPLSLLFLVEVRAIAPAVAGTAVTAGSLVSFLVIPVAARLIQRYGARHCLMASNVLTAGGYGLYFVADGFGSVLGAALLVMSADRLYGAAWPTALARVADGEELTRWFSFVNFVKTACLGTGAVAATGLLAVAGRSGLSVALAVNAISSVVAAAVLVGVALPERGADPAGSGGGRSSVWSALRDQRFRSLVLSQTLLSFAWLIPTIAFPVYLVSVLGLPAYWPTLVVTARYAGIAVLQMPLSRLTARSTRARVLAGAIALAGCAVAVTAAIPLLPAACTGAAAVLVAALLAVAELTSKPTAAAAAVRLAPPGDEGPYMAVFQLTWTVSYAVGPAIIGIGLGRPLLLWIGIGLAVLGSGVAHLHGRARVRT
ncbi:MFS transporter [Actinoplanes teichomyceticus]|uniref:Putative MFS family arabinose efflux permease n=1 Tax=Actinoplanes teichomyceticus TaxID=1867 RepID=A0A561WKQ2_ACTTI|nr:MFS transporter [Actinoplanes teichomyceticus]TWG24447.1 putative MFS family arabinose efflux permease [Actinoplanes teichomyceticus]GIF12702.1 MFS transporter [Actinoplanes teichomyceticus]